MNCLQFALNVWKTNNNYKIYYNSEHCINLPNNSKADGFLGLELYGFDYFKKWYTDYKVIPKNSYNILIEYFKTYFPDLLIEEENNKDFSDIVYIYSDGACAVHSTKNGGYAFVVVYNDEIIYENFQYFENTTNSEMEVNGLYNALLYCKNNFTDEKVIIRCDSDYVVKGYNEWSNGWRKKNWKNSKGVPVKYMDIWKEIDSLRFDNVKVEWVKAHDTDKWNNYVDSLTRK